MSERISEIEARLAGVPAKGESAFIGLLLPVTTTTELWNLRQLAREDVAYLLAELRARDEKLARVGVIEQRLAKSRQTEDQEIAEDLRAAMDDTP